MTTFSRFVGDENTVSALVECCRPPAGGRALLELRRLHPQPGEEQAASKAQKAIDLLNDYSYEVEEVAEVAA